MHIPRLYIYLTLRLEFKYEKVSRKRISAGTLYSKPEVLRQHVFMWMAEYSERNHIRMARIISKLKQEDECDDNVAYINKIGCDIDKEGGFTAQRACFYIVVNFIDENDERLKMIKYYWHGAGKWLR